MWSLITKLEPPRPPEPQIPLQHFQNYINNMYGPQLDNSLKTQIGGDPPISYCSLLMDPVNDNDYTYVDQDLRWTIYQCMYHRPEDRPELHTLLEQARGKINENFPNETDQYVREWVHTWYVT